MTVFNQELLKIRKNRIEATAINFNFLKKELAVRTADRLSELKGNFPNTLELGCGLGELFHTLAQQEMLEKFPYVLQADYFLNFLNANDSTNKINLTFNKLPFKANSFDGIISIFALHSMNNLPNIFSQIHKVLKPQGFFFLVMPILGTLEELKTAMTNAETELFNSFSPHIHPFASMQSLADLLQSIGFQSITADKDKIEIMYKNFNNIFKDLKGYGETNVLYKRSSYYLGKAFFKLVEKKYQIFQNKENNHYPVSVEYCNIIGWKG
ncbi:methyltransferase domain-containing protein [Candidatus Hepatincola sp. Av]